MKLHFKLVWVLLVFFPGMLEAQNTLDSFLETVRGNNPALNAARKEHEAETASAKTGLFPGNPEIEYGYLYGSPSGIENRTDFNITQTFDFPTVYLRKSEIARSRGEMSGFKLEAVAQDILLNAEKAYINALFMNARVGLIRQRMEISRKILAGYKEKFDRGESNILELNQARLKESSLRNEYYDLLAEIGSNQLILRNLCGGISFPVTDSVFPPSRELVLDTLLAAFEKSPALRYYQEETGIKLRMKKLEAGYNLPKFSAGYYSEKIVSESLRGFHAGITIPLWENAGRVRKAAAEAALAESQAQRYAADTRTQLEKNYHEWRYALNRLADFSELLSTIPQEVYKKALDAGEMSLSDFYYETDLYYQNRIRLLEYRHEVALKEAEITKVYL